MKFLLTSIFVLTASSVAEKTDPFNICKCSDVVPYMDGRRRTIDNLWLKTSSEAPDILQNLEVSKLHLTPNWSYCNASVFNSTEEPLSGITGYNFTLYCTRSASTWKCDNKTDSILCLHFTQAEYPNIPPRFIADFPNLQEFVVHDLHVENITHDLFSRVNRNLQKLGIIAGEVSNIQARSFAKFHQLEDLLLYENKITYLQSEMFDGLDALTYLNLKDNNITELRRHTFSKLRRLENLFLPNNQIHYLEPGTFSDCNLSGIILWGNNLTNIPKGVFSDLKNLEALYLDSNWIADIPRDSFKGSTKLRKLFLSNNRIHRIEPFTFSDWKLLRLNLMSNELDHLASDTFNGLQVDYAVELEGNKLSEIESQAFRNLKATFLNLNLTNITGAQLKFWGVDSSINVSGIFAENI